MARYNSINTTSSVSGGSTISTPASGLLTTLTGSGTINIPSPVLYTGSIQTYYNSTASAITITTPSGVINGPGLGGGSGSLSLPAGSIITLVSDGANYLTQDWIGGNVSATTLSASAGVNLSPATGTITINPTTAGTIANMAISGSTGSFSTLTASAVTTITGGTAVTLGTAASGALQVSGGVGITGGITVASDSYFGSKITIGVATPRQALTIGQNATSVSTATPDSIDIGGTFSSTAGQNLKLKLWNAVAFTNYYIGLGISSNSLDYVVNDNGTNTFSHNWYTGKGGSTTPVQVMSLTSGGVLTFPQTTGVKIRLYDASNDKYGFEVQSSELRMYSGAQGVASGGITFGKYDGTTWTENIRFTNAGYLGLGISNPVRPFHGTGEFSWTPGTNNANTAFFNAHDSAGSNGNLMSVKFRGLSTAGASEVALASFQVNATQTSLGGYVLKPGSPVFQAYGSSSGTVVNNATVTVPWPNVVSQVGTAFNSSTSVFTAPVAGYYFFYVQWLQYPNNFSAGNYSSSWISKNGATYGSGASMFRWAGQQQQQTCNISQIHYLAVNDTVSHIIVDSSSGQCTYYNQPGHGMFCGYLIG